VLYGGGLSASRIAAAFPWYVSPLLPGLIVLAGYGVQSAVDWSRKRISAPSPTPRAGLSVEVALVLIIVTALMIHHGPRWRYVFHRAVFGDRVQVYLALGEWLGERCAPGDVILAGEVGALAYAMPAQAILDSSGINSPEVLEARSDDSARLRALGVIEPRPEGSRDWVVSIIARFAPRYIVTYRPWLHVEELPEIPWIRGRYHRLVFDNRELNDYFVLQRRDDPGAG
jgi:hypothetical protein